MLKYFPKGILHKAPGGDLAVHGWGGGAWNPPSNAGRCKEGFGRAFPPAHPHVLSTLALHLPTPRKEQAGHREPAKTTAGKS